MVIVGVYCVVVAHGLNVGAWVPDGLIVDPWPAATSTWGASDVEAPLRAQATQHHPKLYGVAEPIDPWAVQSAPTTAPSTWGEPARPAPPETWAAASHEIVDPWTPASPPRFSTAPMIRDPWLD